MDPKESAPCPVCGGTGWKAIETEGQRSVARCDCFQRVRLDHLLRRAGIPPRYETCSFENFDPRTDRLNLAKAAAIKFAEEFPLADCGLLIMGPCGSGKTHLAVSVLRQLIFKWEAHSLFYDFRELLKKIQNSYNAVSHTSEMQILEPVLDCQVLVLDDLGAERPTEWVSDTIAYIVNSRYNRKLTTLITTNFDDRARETRVLAGGARLPAEESLEDRIGTRLRSRLYEMCKVISIEGAEDYRIRMKPQHLF